MKSKANGEECIYAPLPISQHQNQMNEGYSASPLKQQSFQQASPASHTQATLFHPPNMSALDQPTMVLNNSYQLPYQDVPIKINNSSLQSPSNPDQPTAFITNDPTFQHHHQMHSNVSLVPSGSTFLPKPAMSTFQQQNANLLSRQSSMVHYGPTPVAQPFLLNSMSMRGRSLESLNQPFAEPGMAGQPVSNYCFNTGQYCNAGSASNYYNANQAYQYQQQQQAQPGYQYSNGDIYGASMMNRQTICLDNNPHLINPSTYLLPMPNTNPLPDSFAEMDGTTTLNRPKSLLKNKPIAKIVASRQSELYADSNYDTNSVKSMESYDSSISFVSSNSSDIYSTFARRQPPPPPPKRVNSVKKVNGGGSFSVPSSPMHSARNGDQRTNFPTQQPQRPPTTEQPSYENIDSFTKAAPSQQNSEDVFASCVKSLTNKFSELHSLVNNDFNNDHSKNLLAMTSREVMPLQQAQQPLRDINQTAHQQSSTLPLNKKDTVLGDVSVNAPVSSSSSTESMPFAIDNQSTIRQKNSAYLQSAMAKFGDGSSSSKASSSSSSSSSTSSPMHSGSRNMSLPGSNINSPSTTNANFNGNGFNLINEGNILLTSYSNLLTFQLVGNNLPANKMQTSNLPMKSSSSSQQNVVDSLEDIEIMLANLKTQLDQIE